MATCIFFGFAGPQDPIYGISRSNITDRLTRRNCNTKAIVRDGIYVWIAKGSISGNGNRATRYFVRTYGRDRKEKTAKHFERQRDAIEYANSLSTTQGALPREEVPPTVIASIRRGPRA